MTEFGVSRRCKTLPPQFRERCFDPREDRGLPEFRKYLLCRGQLLKCKFTSFLSFAKQANEQFCMASVMSCWIEMRILQHTSRQSAKTRWCSRHRLQKKGQIPQ